MRKLSDNQQLILRTLARLCAAAEGGVVPARAVARALSVGTDGPAYTLRSLVKRGLVKNGHHPNDMYGYCLTVDGEQWMKEHPCTP